MTYSFSELALSPVYHKIQHNYRLFMHYPAYKNRNTEQDKQKITWFSIVKQASVTALVKIIHSSKVHHII